MLLATGFVKFAAAVATLVMLVMLVLLFFGAVHPGTGAGIVELAAIMAGAISDVTHRVILKRREAARQREDALNALLATLGSSGIANAI